MQWIVPRSFVGARGLRAQLASHRADAVFASWVEADPDFDSSRPTRFSVVCCPWDAGRLWLSGDALNSLNARLLDAINESGEVLLSHTRLVGHHVQRAAIGHERTTLEHVSRASPLLVTHLAIGRSDDLFNK